MSNFIPETIVQPGMSAAAERLNELQLRMRVRADQYAHWRNGERVLAETYLQRYPALAADLDGLLDVLLREILLRRAQGEIVQLDEYIRRFPQCATALRDCADQVSAPSDTAPTTMRPPITSASSSEAVPPSQVAATLNAPADLLSGEQLSQPAADARARGACEGETVPGYVILAELGRGGMGVVYKARQLRLNRIVALKMILHADHASQEEQDRFRREGEALAQLQHENIVQIYEVGEHESKPFFSLEYVEGGSLDRHLKGTPQQPDEAAALLEKLARAMHSAHAVGIVHRDLKPANVLLQKRVGENGAATQIRPNKKGKGSAGAGSASATTVMSLQPKITDFGLAKNVTEAGQTQSGSILGTPSYMAPEQAAGRVHAIDGRTDVYALGAILYECLTGRPPFKAATAMDTVLQVLNDEPVRPRQLQPKLPRDLETICLKCLQKDPGKRYQSAEALAADLRRFQEGDPIVARPVRVTERVIKWVRRRPMVAALLAVVALVTAAGAIAVAWQHGVALAERDHALQAEQVAAEERDKAREAEAEARTQELQAQQQKQRADEHAAEVTVALGRSRVLLSELAWLEGDAGLAHKRLGEVEPGLRSWEWGYLKRRFNGGLFTLLGHLQPVTAVCFSPDGTRLASGSVDETVKIWDARTGRPLQTLRGHTQRVTAVAFRPDGQRLASVSWDGKLKVWDTQSGHVLLEPAGKASSLLDVSFSPDGKQLVAATSDGILKFWDAADGQPLPEIKAHTSSVFGLCFSPDGKRLASAGEDKAVKVWDVQKRRMLLDLEGHTDAAEDVRFSPDGKKLASASRDQTIRVWSADDGRHLLTLKGHTGFVYTVSFSPDGQRLASAGADMTVKVWDAQSGQRLYELRGHSGATRAAFSPDGQRLVSASWDRALKVWDARSELQMLTVRDSALLRSVSFSPDGSRLATAGDDRAVKVWDAREGLQLLLLTGHKGVVGSVRFSPDGERLVSASADRTVKVWHARDGQLLRNLTGHQGTVHGACFSPDGRHVASASADKTVRLWNADTGKELHALKGHDGAVLCVSFSRDGTRLASGSADEAVTIWDAHTGREVRSLHGHTERVTAVSFSPDRRRLASAGADGKVKIWDAQSGELLLEPAGNTLPVLDLCFNPDGKRLVAGLSDNTVKVWDAQGGEQLLLLKGHQGPVSGVAFSADGQSLASVSEDRSIKIWSARTGGPLIELKGHTGEVLNLSFRPDGQRLASAGRDGTIKVWSVSSGRPLLTLTGPAGDVRRVCFSPDGKRLVSASEDRTIRIWNATNGEQLLDFKGPRVVTALAFRADGAMLAAGADRTVRIWDTVTGKLVRTLDGHQGTITGVAFSPDGRRIVSSARAWDAVVRRANGEIRVWDANNGRVLLALRHPRDLARPLQPVLSVAFSPDGQRLVYTNTAGQALVRDAATGAPLPAATDRPGNESQGLSPDGRFLVRSLGSVVHLVDLFSLSDEEQAHRRGLTAFDPAWHTAEAQRYEQAKQWQAAAFHLGQLLSAAPLDLNLYSRHARACARSGQTHQAAVAYLRLVLLDPEASVWPLDELQKRAKEAADKKDWKQAADTFALLVHQAPDQVSGWSGLLRSRLAAGQPELYRQTCERMLARFENTEDPSLANSVAWNCCLTPGAVVAPERFVALAERSLANRRSLKAPHNLFLNSLHTLGAALVRAGRYAEAIKILKEDVQLRGSPGAVEDWLFLALAYSGLNQPGEAKKCLERAAGLDALSRDWVVAVERQQLQREAETLVERTAPIVPVVLGPEGNILASVAREGAVRLWDLGTGREQGHVKGHTGGTLVLALSRDGKTLATGGTDRVVRLWDVATRTPGFVLEGHTGPISVLAFSRDGRLLASGSGSWDERNHAVILGEVRLWDVATGRERDVIQFSGGVTALAFDATGNRLALGTRNGTVRLWDVVNHRELRTLTGASRAVRALAFSADGGRLVAAGDDRALRSWDLARNVPPAVWNGHTRAVWSLAFSPDGKIVASGSADQTVKLWHIEGGQDWCTLREHTAPVLSVSFGGDGNLFSGCADETVRRWALGATPGVFPKQHTGIIWSVALLKDRKTVASASEDGTARLWDLGKRQERAVLRGHGGPAQGKMLRTAVNSVIGSPDGKTLASGSADRTVKLWDVGTGKERLTLRGHTNTVAAVCFSPDGKTLASGSADHTAKLWDVATGKEKRTLRGHTNWVRALSFSPAGKTLVTASYDRTLKLWDVDTGKELKTFKGHEDQVFAVAFSPDGKTLVSGSQDKTIKLWDLKSGQVRRTLTGHTDKVYSLVFTRDGKTLISSSRDKSIKVWDIGTGQERLTLKGHTAPVMSIALSAEGDMLISGSEDRQLRLWPVPSSRLLFRPSEKR